ncbi:hypothetical protein [Streptomyces sp. DSM 118878]
MGKRIVVVHGIGQEYGGPNTLQPGIARAIQDGLELAGGPHIDASDVVVGFYGHLFRPGQSQQTKGSQDAYTFRDVHSPAEVALLAALCEGVGYGGSLQSPAGSKAVTPRFVQRSLLALSRSPFFAGAGERFLIGVLKQVTAYLNDDGVRCRVQAEISAAIRPETEVVVGHSLGSVVAYEALCARRPDWSVKAFVTIGSPLGIPNLVLGRLRPVPVSGRGRWPLGISSWSNLCDTRDVVALVKQLKPLFGSDSPEIEDVLIDNGWQAHSIDRHLTAKETGAAIARGLSGSGGKDVP